MHQIQLLIDGTYLIDLPTWVLVMIASLMLLGTTKVKR